MKLRFLGALAALALFGMHHAARADVAWETDYQRAVMLSRSTGKPLFIDIYTDWCGWCKKLDTDVYPNPRVQQLSRNFVMLKLNAEGRDEPYARALKPQGFPSLYFVSSSHQIVGHFGGYVDANTFASGMQQALGREAALKQAAPSPQAKTKQPAAPSVTRLPSASQAPLDWRSQPDLRKLANQENSGGVFLLDDTGVVALDAKAKKSQAKSKKNKVAPSKRGGKKVAR